VQDASSKQQKYKPNNQQTGLPPHSALSVRGKTNKQKLSTNILRGKERKNSTLKPGERKPQAQ